MTKILIRSCFSCGDDPSQVPEGRPLNIEIAVVAFSGSTCIINNLFNTFSSSFHPTSLLGPHVF